MESWNPVLINLLTRNVEGTYLPATSPESHGSPLLNFSQFANKGVWHKFIFFFTIKTFKFS